MKSLRIAAISALVSTLLSVGAAFAQDPAYNTSFITSITYQNVGTASANVAFQFYPQGNSTPTTVNRTLNSGAGSSLFIGGNDVGLVAGFQGSAVMSSNQPMVATLVQIPQSTTVKNRPLSIGFSTATSKVLLATLLKNQFSTSSKFSIQNASSSAVDLKISFFNAADPTAAPIVKNVTNIPQGSAAYVDMGTESSITAASFNGSATVEGFVAGTQTPANIVGSALELSTTGISATAFEGVPSGNTKVFVATALCKAFGGATTAYAVQNVGSTTANVSVKYKGKNLTDSSVVDTEDTGSIEPGAKKSFLGCTKNPDNFSGAATIESTSALVVIAKVSGSLSTAWLGEAQGASKLAHPYVRFSDATNFDSGKYQKAFIAIQNVGTSAVSNVVVEYRDKNGTLLGKHTIANIDAGAKANSNPTLATPESGITVDQLTLFGNPESNPGGGFGGGALVVGPSGSQLISVVRIQTNTANGSVAEDYNGVAVQ